MTICDQAGADIAEMTSLTAPGCLRDNFLSNWEFIGAFKKPLIAAVAGYAVICAIIDYLVGWWL